ncbi:MAG: hypothetical protein ABSG64_02905 [Solirubrobacteraceae bacterium]
MILTALFFAVPASAGAQGASGAFDRANQPPVITNPDVYVSQDIVGDADVYIDYALACPNGSPEPTTVTLIAPLGKLINTLSDPCEGTLTPNAENDSFGQWEIATFAGIRDEPGFLTLPVTSTDENPGISLGWVGGGYFAAAPFEYQVSVGGQAIAEQALTIQYVDNSDTVSDGWPYPLRRCRSFRARFIRGTIPLKASTDVSCAAARALMKKVFSSYGQNRTFNGWHCLGPQTAAAECVDGTARVAAGGL